MKVKDLSYRAWEVESEDDVTRVIWDEKRGFVCERDGKKMCEHKKEVIAKLNGGFTL